MTVRHLHPGKLLAFGISCALLSTSPAQADEQDTFNLRLSESLTRDNNLFRLPAGVDPASVGIPKSKRADTIRTDSVSLTMDKTISLQRFHLGAYISHYDYNTYDYLNYDAKNFDGRWDWSLTPHITGELSADRNQLLNNFADYGTYTRNIRTTDNVRFRSEFGTGSALRLTLGASQGNSKNSLMVNQDGNTRTRAAQAGARYAGEAGNTVGYWYRQNDIEWTDRALNEFALYDTKAKQSDHEVYGTWRFSPQTAIDGAVTRVKRKHSHYAVRNYSGTAGRVGFNWEPTTTLRLGVFANRNYGTWWTFDANYVITDTYGVTAQWQVSDKIIMSARYEHGERKFKGDTQVLPPSDRADKTDTGQIGLDWEPMRNFFMGMNVAQSKRSSNRSGLDYDDTTTSLQARMTF